jgi:hypothetical protein
MHLRRGFLAAPALIAALVAVVSVPQAAMASVGVGIQANPVRLTGRADPGGSYTLPPVFVINSGTKAETIRIAVERVSRGPGRAVPRSWIQVSGPTVQLRPGKAARIPLELVLPGAARPGAYLSDIVATASAPISAGRTNLGAAAATMLEFRVGQAAAAGFWPTVVKQTLWALLIVVLLGAVALAVRWSRVRIRVERRAAGYRAADQPRYGNAGPLGHGTAGQHGGWHA